MTHQFPKFLFCNIAWMERYNGHTGMDTPKGAGSYVDSTGHAFEVCNFSNIGGLHYGYVQPPPGQIKSGKGEDVTMDISRVGDDIQTGASGEMYIDGVMVIWTAPENGVGSRKVVGWYNDAIVYRESQPIPSNDPKFALQQQEQNSVTVYRIVGKQKDSVLLPISKRLHLIPKAKKGGSGMGESNIWYADDVNNEEHREIVRGALDYIKGYQGG